MQFCRCHPYTIHFAAVTLLRSWMLALLLWLPAVTEQCVASLDCTIGQASAALTALTSTGTVRREQVRMWTCSKHSRHELAAPPRSVWTWLLWQCEQLCTLLCEEEGSLRREAPHQLLSTGAGGQHPHALHDGPGGKLTKVCNLLYLSPKAPVKRCLQRGTNVKGHHLSGWLCARVHTRCRQGH